MTDSTTRAKKLLADAEHEPDHCRTDCDECWAMLEACGTIGQNKEATLAVAIKLATLLAQEHGTTHWKKEPLSEGSVINTSCEEAECHVCKALAEWAGLFKKEEANV